MAASDLQAVLVLFDNSMSSINGDFVPTRIDAQKAAVEVLARSYIRGNRESCIGFGTLSGACGINTSLTKDMRKLRTNLDEVARDGTIHFDQAVKCALFALKHRPKEITMRHLILIVGSKHDLTLENAERLAALTNKEGVIVDLVVFGDDDIDLEPLRRYIELLGTTSRYITVAKSTKLLCDAVQDALVSAEGSVPAAGEDGGEDAELAQAMAASRAEAGIAAVDYDDELQRALQLSMEEAQPATEDDPELQEAIRLSQIENKPNEEKKKQNT